MKKKVLLVLCVYNITFIADAQSTGFFHHNVGTSLCKFSTDAIYFYGLELIKTDYNGNVIWTKSPNPFNRFTVEGNAIYGTNGIKVFKFDTAGNSIWTKGFSTPIYAPDTNLNNVSDVIFDGSKLFVCVQQNDRTIGYGSQGEQAIITLDTSGNILNAVIDTNFWATKQTIGFKSLRKGGWLGYFSLNGNNHPGYILKIDSTGNFSQNAYSVVCLPGTAYLQDIIQMADSTYMVVFNQIDFVFSTDFFFCAKIREDGSIIWTHGYTVDGAISYISSALNIAVDSLNYTYIVGASDYLFALKLNNSGDVVLAKGWTHPNPDFNFYESNYNQIQYGFNGTHYKDGKIYCFGNYKSYPAILIFDTLFNNPCYTPDTNLNVYQTSGLSASQPITNTNTFAYNPATASFTNFSVANSATLDLCAALDVKNISKDNAAISFYPNPLTSSSILQLNTQVTNAEVIIYDIVGKEIMRKKLTGHKMEIEKGSLESGVYFVKVVSEERQWVAKLVVE